MVDTSELYEEYTKWHCSISLHCTELAEATVAECYAFAGRMRKYLPDCQHAHVGLFAHSLVMRCCRKGMSFDEFEKRLDEKFGPKEDIFQELS